MALTAVVIVGAALRLWQYAADTSQWTDELALTKGILTLDLWQLLTAPLLFQQVAPRGFLLVEKLLVMVLGPSDYALRLFPLFCSLVALLVFARLAARTLEGAGPLAASVLFATAAPFIAFGSLVKQFSADVCVAVLLWWLAYELTSRPLTPRRAVWAALLGSLLVWFSLPGVLMAAALGAALLVWPPEAHAGGHTRRLLAPVLACWGVSSLAVTLVSFATLAPGAGEYVRRFWAIGYAPRSAARFFETLWPLDQMRLLFGPGLTHAGLAYRLPTMYAALTALGFVVLWRRDRRTAALLFAPTVLTLGAAVVGRYPFSERLILFLVPAFMLAIAAAVEAVRRLLHPYSRVLAASVCIALLLPALYPLAASPPVYYTEHMKPVLSYVRERRQPGDGIYVYYGAALAVTFYGERYGLKRSEYAVGGCRRGDTRRYLRELDTFRGRPRVWLLLTHAVTRLREGEDILAYLDAVGTRKDSFVFESRTPGRPLPPAAAYLYDLSDAGKLSRADAETFPLTGPPSDGRRLGCGEGSQAMSETDFCKAPVRSPLANTLCRVSASSSRHTVGLDLSTPRGRAVRWVRGKTWKSSWWTTRRWTRPPRSADPERHQVHPPRQKSGRGRRAQRRRARQLGRLLAFLDDDDLRLPGTLDLQLQGTYPRPRGRLRLRARTLRWSRTAS